MYNEDIYFLRYIVNFVCHTSCDEVVMNSDLSRPAELAQLEDIDGIVCPLAVSIEIKAACDALEVHLRMFVCGEVASLMCSVLFNLIVQLY